MPYFLPKEFACKCGRSDCDAPPMDLEFLDLLDKLREKWGKPMVITSGVRCVFHNKNIGGAKRSQHLVGKAVDIRATMNEARVIHALAESLGFGGVEIGRGLVHVDTGPKRHWIYV